jgi:hypothetical protein
MQAEPDAGRQNKNCPADQRGTQRKIKPPEDGPFSSTATEAAVSLLQLVSTRDNGVGNKLATNMRSGKVANASW